MKKKLLLLISWVLFYNATANAFSQGITFNFRNAPLLEVFSEISKQTKYNIVCGNTDFQERKITISVINATLEEALDKCLNGLPYFYSISGKFVIFKKKLESERNQKESDHITPGELTGRVTNEKGEPIAGATIIVKGTDKITTSGNDGYFTIKGIDNNAEIKITSVGYEPKIVKLTGDKDIKIKLVISVQNIREVIVKGSTGYQFLDKNNPGSFDLVNNELMNRSVSSDIISRIENLTPGVSFKNANDGVLIRGRNSIFSNVSPLIVVDNFPYDGDINNINPNDVENITILKDAAAASIWGARAGNGVIVITTKRGKSGKPTFSFTSNVTLMPKPNLAGTSRISAADYVELEKELFAAGYYEPELSDEYSHIPMTPVVEILVRKLKGEISEEDANLLIDKYKLNDVRSDLKDYFYRSGNILRNSVNVSGSNSVNNYFLSAGWDRNSLNLKGNKSDRITFRSQNTFRLSSVIQFDAGLSFVTTVDDRNGNVGTEINSGSGKQLYPYADLVNESGKAMVLVKDFRSSFTDTAGYGKIMNWKYLPYDDMYATKVSNRGKDFLINTGVRIQILNGLNFELKYQYENYISSSRTLYSEESYFARNIINRFYQPMSSNPFPIPKGGVILSGTSEFVSHQGRAQINFNRTFNNKHQVNAFTGWEIKNLKNGNNSFISYGYKKDGNTVVQNIDFLNKYPQFNNEFITQAIPNSQELNGSLDRFISIYGNASYSFDNRYHINASARNDAANLFGVKTNRQGVPLWSIGAGWEISNESFYKLKNLDYLRLRLTYGSNGNFGRFSGISTASYYSSTTTGATGASLINPPNEKLRWERVSTINVGLDFRFIKDRIQGSIEYYTKKMNDVLGQAPVDPTLGIGSYYGNVASMNGKGWEVNLSFKVIDSKVKWTVNTISSYALNKVQEYLMRPSVYGNIYINSDRTVKPLIGKPVYSVLSYAFKGLDPMNGDPVGYYGKNESKNWSEIRDKTILDSLIYNGPSQPTYFGAIRNTVTWKTISLSVNVSYKLGHVIRRPSISYTGLFSSWTGHGDYSNRWQKEGDEKFTTVPSKPTYPFFIDVASRDEFYSNSDALIIKAGHVRLEDIRLAFEIDNSVKWLPARSMNVFLYASNLNILLWKQNNVGLDPYFPQGGRDVKNISVGLNVTF